MGIVVLAALGVGPAACASAPSAGGPLGQARAEENRVVVPLPPATQVLAVLSLAGLSGAPTLTDVETALGAADIARREAAGVLLTYRLETCALALGFSADNDRNEMRLEVAQTAARTPGTDAPTLAACAAELEARNARRPMS